MRIVWLGHSSFYVESDAGLRLLLDPFDPRLGIARPPLEVDLVVASHDHFDHFSMREVLGEPEILIAPTDDTRLGIRFRGLPTFHDLREGYYRGDNTMVSFELDGVHLCHAGDLGHPLSRDQVTQLGRIDVLMLPVGGNFSLNARLANEVLESLELPYLIPMHYDLPGVLMPLGTVKKFLRGKRFVSFPSEFTLSHPAPGFREREILVLERQTDAARIQGASLAVSTQGPASA